MPAELTILSFEFEGCSNSSNEGTSSDNTKGTKPDLCLLLNKNAQEISQEIEQEMSRSLFRSATQVKAEVMFFSGSILVQGSIIILSWLGSTILKAGKAAAEEQIAILVKVVVQKVLDKALFKVNAGNSEPFRDIQVTSHPASIAEESPTRVPEIILPSQRSDILSRFIPGLIFTDSILLLLILIILLLPYLEK